MSNLYYKTVTPQLRESLELLMNMQSLTMFRLVGGTSLSLQLGHRISIDIDLFTDVEYGLIDTIAIKNELQKTFTIVENADDLNSTALGYTLYCGNEPDNTIKVDLFYTDSYIFPVKNIDNLRLASIQEIAAMKMLAICNGLRKKDYWDIHELMNHFSLKDMIGWGIQRHPYELNFDLLKDKLQNITDFADNTEIICLRKKYWEFIKEDIEEKAKEISL